MRRARFVLVLGALALLAPVAAQEQPSSPGVWITEVDRDADSGETRVLLNVGRDAGLERGDVVAIERAGREIAKAKIYAAYSDMSVATITENPAAVARGDWVKARSKKADPAAEATPIVVEAQGDGWKISAGLERGLREGQEATVIRDGKPVGTVKLAQVTDKSAALKVTEGEVAAGDKLAVIPIAHMEGKGRESDLTREELRKLEQAVEASGELDFANLGFLGVVGVLEHPMPVAPAPCHIGVLVKRVIKGSPAEAAKIRPGDRVIAIDERVVRTPVEIVHGVKRRSGDTIKVTIMREDVLLVVTAEFRAKR
ncbi:MAG TPA: PDZ domain-containing protein [Planctomycetota bacterium]|nr:PDZ domain-containing protein [Planctomycetota bacterium]